MANTNKVQRLIAHIQGKKIAENRILIIDRTTTPATVCDFAEYDAKVPITPEEIEKQINSDNLVIEIINDKNQVRTS